MKNNKIHQLALFGNPVNHSLSPNIHQQFAEQFNVSIDYQLIKTTEKGFAKAVSLFFESGGIGANVTLPHKKNALSIVDKISDRANCAQAVNTLFIDSEKNICGDNTDGIGFICDLSKRCGFDCRNKNILILGAGGATQGIVPEIILQNPKLLVIANRTLKKATTICQYENSTAMTFGQLNKSQQKFDLIIHASSLGHRGKTLKFQKQHMNMDTVCYDLSYNEAAQPFLNYSKSLGASKCFDGYGMLIEQAAYSFEQWFGFIPDTNNIKI
jgi:shikimate dehydrogenase